LCVFVFVLEFCFNIFSILVHNFLTYIFFFNTYFLYMTFYWKCIATSHYFALLLKQTTEVNTLPIAMSHNFPTVALPCLRPSVTTERRVRARIFAFRTLHGLSWYCPSSCQCSYISATYLHYEHRPRYLMSRFCNIFNKNICLSLS